jgi:hypothetical protein
MMRFDDRITCGRARAQASRGAAVGQRRRRSCGEVCEGGKRRGDTTHLAELAHLCRELANDIFRVSLSFAHPRASSGEQASGAELAGATTDVKLQLKSDTCAMGRAARRAAGGAAAARARGLRDVGLQTVVQIRARLPSPPRARPPRPRAPRRLPWRLLPRRPKRRWTACVR